MRTPEQWDELLTCSPMNAQEALRSVRVKPAEIKAIQTDARADLLERMKALEEENARLRHDLMDPPADIQELVIKKLNLVCTEALTQYRVALERWKWKPMDTAPKDGTRVLLLESGFCYVGYWSNSLWVETGGAWIVYEARSDTVELKPNYWMPLPDPPATPLIEKGRK